MSPFIALRHEAINGGRENRREGDALERGAERSNHTFTCTGLHVNGLHVLWHKGGWVLSSETKRPSSHLYAVKLVKSGVISVKERQWGETFDSLGSYMSAFCPKLTQTWLDQPANYKAWQQRWDGPISPWAGVHRCCNMFEHDIQPPASCRDMAVWNGKWNKIMTDETPCFSFTIK